ncbi:MAG: hypothetical protein ACRC3H_02700 [Lachnospiraceae bacterium]
MKKTLTIAGVECRFKSSAAVPRMYRIKFRRDIFVDFSNIEKNIKLQEKIKAESGEDAGSSLPVESLEMFENIAYIMHKHGDPEQPDTIDEWLEQFETFDIYQVLPEILEMWKLENDQMSTPKKKTGQ